MAPVQTFVEVETGMKYAVTPEGHPYYVTPCCKASAKGSGNSPTGVCCRACYAPIDPALGGIPAQTVVGKVV